MRKSTGNYPICIPKDSLLDKEIVQKAHMRTIHGGVSLTIVEVKKIGFQNWISKLPGLARKHFGIYCNLT